MRTSGSSAYPASRSAALPVGALDGPKRAAAALAVFFAASMLAVHLAYSDAGRAAPVAVATAAASLPAAAASLADPPAPPAPDAAPPAVSADAPADAGGGVPDPTAGLSLGVAPVPAPAAPAARERALAACVERAIRAAGASEPRATAPGRWPALKRAREELRQRRLAARTACEADATP